MPSGRGSATGRAVVLLLAAVPAAEAHDPLTPVGKRPWLVVCSCGWERETFSEWAARSVSKLHSLLAPADVAHVTRVEASEGFRGRRAV